MSKFFSLIGLFIVSLAAHCQTVDFSFTSSNNVFCSPSTITFTQNASGNPTSFVWDFGNGTFGDQPSQSSSYATAGSYTVKLIAIYSNTNSVSISKVIVINPAITASIAVDRNFICQAGPVNFTASGSGGNISTYEWNFADNSPVTDLSTNTITHSFSEFGAKTVTLKVTSDIGCTANASIDVRLTPIGITGGVSKPNGCVPAAINFGTNATIPKGSTVASYTWNYGDGSPAITNLSNLSSHTYSLVGQYFPTLDVVTSEGCLGTFNFTRLYFGTPPTGQIAYIKNDSICGSVPATFVSKATNADRYSWNFGDGTISTTTDTIIQHKYTTVSAKQVYVTAFYNACAAPAVGVKIFIKGVIANFSYNNSCNNKNSYSFNDISSGKSTGNMWSFGDATQQVNAQTTNHLFANPGQFNTQLAVYDSLSGCSDSIAAVIYTSTPQIISPDSTVCKNSTVHFDITGYSPNPNALYNWTIFGIKYPPRSATSNDVTANVLGAFNNFVVIDNGPQYCPDTVYLNRQIFVRGPKLDFSVPVSVCYKVPITITNNSTPFIPTDTIVSSYWNYGNGGKIDSVFQPATLNYASAGNYNIKLNSTDKNGCMDSLIKPVSVFPLPFLQVLSVRDTICYGSSDQLIAIHSDAVLWSPATNLSCTACDTSIASPLTSTLYFSTASNAFNCSVMDSTFVQVSIPFTATVIPDAIAICALTTTQVNVLPKGKVITWSPPTGLSDSSIYNPIISPSQSTLYTVTLHDSLGCVTNSSSTSFKLTIKSLPTVNAGPDQVYPKGANYTLSPVYSPNVSAYLWTPSDLLTCNDCAMPNGINDRTQQYIVRVTSDSGCINSDTVLISIECKYANLFMPKAFTPNNDGLNDYFYPICYGIKSITRFIIYDRKGQVVFQARNFSPNNRSLGWDGRFKGEEQAVGSYVYILEAVCDLGEKLFKKDSFILLR